MRSIRRYWALLALLIAASPAIAQTPTISRQADPHHAPYAPGGNIDVTARIIAEKLKDVLGVNVLVENKAGASA